jgi:hypothetical protein
LRSSMVSIGKNKRIRFLKLKNGHQDIQIRKRLLFKNYF